MHLQKSSEIHSFIQRICTEHRLCARHCSQTGDTKANKTDLIFCPQGSYSPGKNEGWSLEPMTEWTRVGDLAETVLVELWGEGQSVLGWRVSGT